MKAAKINQQLAYYTQPQGTPRICFIFTCMQTNVIRYFFQIIIIDIYFVVLFYNMCVYICMKIVWKNISKIKIAYVCADLYMFLYTTCAAVGWFLYL